MHTQGRLTVWEPGDPVNRHGFPIGLGPQLCVVSAYTGVINEDDAVELVRRWNAFEPGGAVEQAVKALTMFERIAPVGHDIARAALVALIDASAPHVRE